MHSLAHKMKLEQLYVGHQQKICFARINSVKLHHLECPRERVILLDSRWNVMAHGDAREGKWRGNWRMECVASTLHTTSEHGVSSITTADAHTSAASSRLNWRPRRFKWTRPFRRKTKSVFCACAITFRLASNSHLGDWVGFGKGNEVSWCYIRKHRTEFRNLPIYSHDAGHLDEIWPILEYDQAVTTLAISRCQQIAAILCHEHRPISVSVTGIALSQPILAAEGEREQQAPHS